MKSFNIPSVVCIFLISLISCSPDKSTPDSKSGGHDKYMPPPVLTVFCKDIYPPSSEAISSCQKNMHEIFHSPPLTCYPAVYWAWNGEMDDQKMAMQIEDMKQTGYSTVIIFTYKGIPFEYLSDTWFEKVRTAAGLCRDQGLKLWLIDDGSFPTGFVNGAVTDNNPELRQQKLSQISRIILHKNIPFYYASDENIVAVIARRIDTAEYHAIDLTSLFNGGRMSWPGQPYNYEISVYAMQPTHKKAYNIYTGGSQYGHSFVPDHLNPGATDMFIELTYKKYKEKLADYIPDTFEGIMSDESSLNYRSWTKSFLNEFEKRKGYSIRPYLPLLFDPFSELLSRQVHFDYKDVCSQLFNENFHLLRMNECMETGWKNVFQPDRDDDDYIATNHSTGDLFNVNLMHSMPTLDVIWRQIWYGCANDFPKLPSSVAQLEGKTDVLSEIMAAYGFGTTTEHLRWVSDYQLVRGVNWFAMHFYSYAFDEWRPYHIPPDFSSENYPLRVHLRNYNDYLARMNVIFQHTTPVSSVALYYPRESTQAVDIPDIFEKSHAIARFLLENQIDFTWIDADALQRSEIEDGRLITPGDMSFDALILSEQPITSERTGEVISELARSGGHVFSENEIPAGLKGSGMPGPERIIQVSSEDIVLFRNFTELHEKLSTSIRSQVNLIPHHKNIRLMIRENKDDNYYACFIFNEGSDHYSGKLELKGEGNYIRIEEWNPSDGKVYPASCLKEKEHTSINLHLYPGTTRLFLICKSTDPIPSPATLRHKKELTLKDHWRIRFGDEDNAVNINKLIDWKEIRRENFSGTASYEVEFELTSSWNGKTVMLDLGLVQYSARISLNGELVASLPWPPFACYISHVLKPGKNKLSVEVTNTLANRYMNPDAIEKAKAEANLHGTYIEKYRSYDVEMLYGGLKGPVRLVMID